MTSADRKNARTARLAAHVKPSAVPKYSKITPSAFPNRPIHTEPQQNSRDDSDRQEPPVQMLSPDIGKGCRHQIRSHHPGSYHCHMSLLSRASLARPVSFFDRLILFDPGDSSFK